jgi:hypothetical protein
VFSIFEKDVDFVNIPIFEKKAKVDEESVIGPYLDAEEQMKEALLGIMTEEEKEALEEEV